MRIDQIATLGLKFFWAEAEGVTAKAGTSHWQHCLLLAGQCSLTLLSLDIEYSLMSACLEWPEPGAELQ